MTVSCQPHTKGHAMSICPCMWSTQKKIDVLQQELEVMDERKDEIKILIDQLKAEK
ncbi:hypothetical protein JW935_00215 [candidate division KSB1 bacterium]|nr:hypothetical protein [candidate division KSB1 bacterium]